MGAFSTSGNVNGAYAGIEAFRGIRTMTSTTIVRTNAATWAVKGICPYQNE